MKSYEPTPKVKVGDKVRVVRIHPASSMEEKQLFEDKIGIVSAIYPNNFCCEGEILVKGSSHYVREWELITPSRADEIEAIRDRVFDLANSFAGDETGHIAQLLHTASNCLTIAKKELTRD